ncbi:LPXTG cell wall anchor domain-containing protein [Fictibacillus nanhaiensis]|uniref:LPXTG cell wall anchor domain-containing protein n=1 Tax=Fictibacillus nanhaiensis TaxID=742169 RepID=UPI003C165E19
MKLLKLLLTSLLFLLIQSTLVHAQTNESLNIDTSPSSFLFNLTNMKPGDWATRKLTIQNRGAEDFKYNTQAIFKDGSKELYNEFLLKVWDSKGVLHTGKLKDFKGLPARYLNSEHQEDLMFEVKFPYELGNEFQGLAFDVEFKFIVEDKVTEPNEPSNPDDGGPINNLPGDDDSISPERPIPSDGLNSPPVEGQILPETSTNTFNYLFSGILFLLLGATTLYKQRRKTIDL